MFDMKQEIKLDQQPIRLFKSDFLEFFTHIHPAVIVVIWTPVVVWNLYQPFLDPGIALSAGLVAVAFLIGILVWSFTEYTMHRFVFHFEPKNPGPTMERVIYLFHGVHHHQPQCKTRLVMPPLVSVPLATAFWFVFRSCTPSCCRRSWRRRPTSHGATPGSSSTRSCTDPNPRKPLRAGIPAGAPRGLSRGMRQSVIEFSE
jgi:hypothetical protein